MVKQQRIETAKRKNVLTVFLNSSIFCIFNILTPGIMAESIKC